MSLAFFFLALCILWIILGTTYFKIHPFLVLLSAALFLGISTGIPLTNLVGIIGKGFGKTIENIGLLILFGTIIGVVLEESKATHTIANTLLNTLSRLPLPYAVSCIGYIVSIPVFCDSAFVILSSLNKSLASKTKTPMVALTVALSTGLFAPHVLIPPTPGPLAAAANLEVENLFLLIVYGAILAFLLVIVGAIYAHFLSKRIPFSEQEIMSNDDTISLSNLPPIYQSIAPILVPITLMAIGTLIQLYDFPPNLSFFKDVLILICTPTIALLIGMLLALRLMKRQKKSLDGIIEKGISLAAPILIITGMGGTLGLIIQQLPLNEFVSDKLVNPHWGLLIPFLLAAVLKTAQGSSTVSIITSTSIMFPLLGVLGLESELGKVWVILAVGVGSMTVSHANDSYFWIVSQLGGLDIKSAYKYHTFGTFLQGTIGFVLVALGYAITQSLFGIG